MKNEKNDCDVILNGIDNVFGNLGNVFDSALDEKKSKMQVVGSIFGFGGSVMKLGWNAGGCAIKHAPKAIATVASAKRELTDTITEEYHKYQIEQKEQELDDKIAQLKYKPKTKLLN